MNLPPYRLNVWRERLRRFGTRVGAPLRDGNDVAFYAGGGEILQAQRDLIARATRSLDVEMYIWADDETGRGFVELLLAAVARDVRVRVIVDAVGCFEAVDLLDRLAQGGARVEWFHPVAPWRPRWGLNERNHRKLVVADDSAAVVSSANLSFDYDSRVNRQAFRDTGLGVAGPVVADLAVDFRKSWRLATGEDLPDSLGPMAGVALPGQVVRDVPVQVLSGIVRGDAGVIRKHLKLLLRRAQREILVANAYFVPSQRLVRALASAARRGVAVTLLLPGHTDQRVVQLATRSTYGRLLRAGVRIFEREGRFLHAKAGIVDGGVLTLGSANLDPRSFLHNLELNLNVYHAGLAEAFRAALAWDFEQSEPVALAQWKERSLPVRLMQHLAYQLRYWL